VYGLDDSVYGSVDGGGEGLPVLDGERVWHLGWQSWLDCGSHSWWSGRSLWWKRPGCGVGW